MTADETISTFLKLLGIPGYTPDASTAYLENTNLRAIWNAFQMFARIPLECQSQIFSFEYYYGGVEDEHLSIAFRRNFYLPFEDDPDELIPLCFAVGAEYHVPKPADYEYIFFLVEVETDLDQAVYTYCNEVEKHRRFWEPFLEVKPSKVSVFQ